ncbi:hypothetical protein ABGB12_32365 [Actinocorallia sp. B10E7]|uniref:hypothetical protein n=1 Tax=Actinocorallia sp. B10E7 TaxID=3153558 RepID=UPI00325DCE4E
MTTHRVLDQSITMPVVVRDASAATIIYDVALAAARRLAPRGFAYRGRHHVAALPVSTVWIEKMHGSFQEPRPLAGERVAPRGTESGR